MSVAMIVLVVVLGLIGLLFLTLLAVWLIGERGRLFGLPSTRAAILGAEGVEKRRLDLKTVHGYFYGAFVYQYIPFCINWLMKRMRPGFKQWWADHYHGKVLPLELAESIITLDQDIPLCDLEQIIPYPTARQIVLEGPTQVTLLDCPCRAASPNPCQPTQVCMIIGDGSFVLDHHPGKSQRVSQQEALELLRAEHQRGHVHTAYFKDACNDRFYAICNCCSCCCGGIQAMVHHGVPMVCSSGFVAQVDEVACAGCGTCAETCPFEAITLDGVAVIGWEACMGCGVCVGQCPHDALTLVRDEQKGIPLDVRALAAAQEAPV